MSEEGYEVRVLAYLNPHHIWVLPVRPSATGKKYTIEHVGLHGVVGQSYELDSNCTALVLTPQPSWNRVADLELTEFLQNAYSLVFTPIDILTSGSIFDDNIYKFGEISCRDKNGDVRHLSKHLQQRDVAMCNINHFATFLHSGQIPQQLNTTMIEGVIKQLLRADVDIPSNHWKQIVLDQTKVFSERKKFEDKVKRECHPIAAEKIINRKQQVFELCKVADYPFLGVTRPERVAKVESSAARKLRNIKAIHERAKNRTKEDMPSRETDSHATAETAKKLTSSLTCTVKNAPPRNKDFMSKAQVEHKPKPKEVQLDPWTKKEMEQKGKSHSENMHYEGSENERSLEEPHFNGKENEIIIHKSKQPVLNKKYHEERDYRPNMVAKSDNYVHSNYNLKNIDPWAFNPEEDGDFYTDRNFLNSDFQEDSFQGSVKFKPVLPNRSQAVHSKPESRSSNSTSSQNNASNVPRYKRLALIAKKTASFISSSETSEHETSTSSDKDFKDDIRRLEHALEKLKTKCKTKNKSKEDVKVNNERQPRPEENITNVKQLDNNQSKSKLSSKRYQLIKARQPKNLNDLDAPILESELNKLETNEALTTLLKEPEFKVKHFDYNCNFIDEVVTPRLMIHSKNQFRIKAITTLEEMPFTQDIHQKLIEMGIKNPLTLQSISWPVILRGLSLFTVNPRRNGKTMGYVPAVCRHVADMKDTNNSGPFAIILCDTARAVVEVSQLCSRFLKNKKVVLSFYAGIDLYELAKNLINDCDILVATPFFLCKLFNLGALSLDLKYLSIVVLDGCEKIEELYYEEFKYFYKMINKMMKTRVNPYHQIQYILAGTQWCDLMDQLSQKVSNVVVSIGYYQECAVYSKPSNVTVVVDDKKIYRVKEFFSQIDTSKRAVVVCNTNEEIKEVSEFLEREKYQVITGGISLSIQKLYRINKLWKDLNVPCLAPVLVCCDDNLRFLNIKDAHYLLHYALPKTFTSFCKRFAVCIDSFKSIFEEGDNEVKIEILVDSENTEQLPKVLQFMKRCRSKIPDILELMSKQTLIKKDEIKGQKYYPVCDNVLSYGECQESWFCDKRHTLFPTCDTPLEWMPKSGIVTFKILNYLSPIHYSALLTSYYHNGEIKVIPSNLTKLSMKVNLFYSDEDNIRLHGHPELGDMCAVSRSRNFYERCRVIKILNTDDKGRATVVVIKLIDEGEEQVVTDVDLYNLPEHLKVIQTHVVQVRLAGLRPKDKELTFSDLAKESLEKKLKENRNVYMRAKIALVIGDTMVVEDLDACQDMEITNDVLKWCSIKEFLCEKHAESNDKHLSKLFELCDSARIEIPKTDTKTFTVRKERNQVKPQYAHLESDSTPLVYFSAAENPGKFFVRLVRFEDCLDKLTNDIQTYVQNVTETVDVKIGNFVLAKFPDDLHYFRARIDGMPSNQTNGKVNCFFVDHGDWRYVGKEDIRALPDSLITILPFQAIECRLVGLKPVGEEWSEWSTSYLYQLCWDKDKDMKQVYVKYCSKDLATETGGYKYGIIMIDTHSDENVIINDLMLNANMAAIREDEQIYLNNITFDQSVSKDKQEDSDSDDSFVDKEWKKEAEPYKNVVYERKIEDYPKFESGFDPQFELNEDDFDFGNEEHFLEALRSSRQESSPKTLPQLLSTNTSEPISKENQSQCSSYEILTNSEKNCLDSDDLSSSEKSVCITARKSDIDLIESRSTLNYVKDHFGNNNEKIDSANLKRKPVISWHQTKCNLTIKIEIADIQEYKLDIKPRSLSFEAYIHETEYAFTLYFYGAVDPDQCSHTPKGLYVLVKLIKLVKHNWRSLSADDLRRRWIVYDQDALQVESDEEDSFDDMTKEFQKYVEQKRELDLEEEEEKYDDGRDDL